LQALPWKRGICSRCRIRLPLANSTKKNSVAIRLICRAAGLKERQVKETRVAEQGKFALRKNVGWISVSRIHRIGAGTVDALRSYPPYDYDLHGCWPSLIFIMNF
jgi:hypothetical protein